MSLGSTSCVLCSGVAWSPVFITRSKSYVWAPTKSYSAHLGGHFEYRVVVVIFSRFSEKNPIVSTNLLGKTCWKLLKEFRASLRTYPTFWAQNSNLSFWKDSPNHALKHCIGHRGQIFSPQGDISPQIWTKNFPKIVAFCGLRGNPL